MDEAVSSEAETKEERSKVMDRRGFLKGILAAGVAPYVSTAAGVLMPIRGKTFLQDGLIEAANEISISFDIQGIITADLARAIAAQVDAAMMIALFAQMKETQWKP
jgi:hypothetical protein